jgi:hypothetical protein
MTSMRALLGDRVGAWRVSDPRLARAGAAGLAALGAVLALVVSAELFPYHSINHDEAVYLQQAELLLSGQLALHPPPGIAESVRPWFFVADGTRLYPKYTPVTAAIFALGELAGGFRLALAGVAAATVGLLYATVAEAFDRPTGLCAAGLLLAAPLFLLQSGVFLSYLPALALSLLFAWAYLRADRTGSYRWAGLAGLAAGLAFFTRPYSAVLFAAPFVAHALWRLRGLDRPVLGRQAVTATVGLAGVALALGYNAAMTGSPLTFPYQAFAPNDGLGFGRHEIVGYERVYDLPLALRAHGQALSAYLGRWGPAGPLGTLLAGAGLASLAVRRVDARHLALAGLFVTIPLGQLYFWGTLNTLGDIERAGDGLIAFLGPYYHVGLLAPTAAFGAVGLRRLVAVARDHVAVDTRATRAVVAAGLLVTAAFAGAVAVGAAAGPVAANAGVADRYERAYEPVENRELSGAVLFLPTPLGEWLNHPFQRLRNEPGFDGDTVYAIPEQPFAVVDTYPDRPVYRYVHRGDWLMTGGDGVTPHLQRVRLDEGRSVGVGFAAGMPAYARSASVRLSAGDPENGDGAALAVEPGERSRLSLTVTGSRARVTGPGLDRPVAVGLNGAESVEVRVFVDSGTTSSFSYRAELPVDRDGDRVRALTPYLEVCRQPRLCGGEAAYVPGAHADGVSLEAEFDD